MHTALPCSGCTEVDDVNKPPFNLGALSISFSGCGFLGIYHMGVVAALRQYIPDLRVIKVAGCSAGALAAVSLLLDTPLGKPNFFIQSTLNVRPGVYFIKPKCRLWHSKCQFGHLKHQIIGILNAPFWHFKRLVYDTFGVLNAKSVIKLH